MRRRSLRLWWAALALTLAACASGPRATVRNEVEQRRLPEALLAYERVRSNDGPDVGLLRHVAGLTLELAVEGDDVTVRDAALSQLQRAGERGRAVLGRLSDHGDVAVRARALEVRAAQGDAMARAELRSFTDSGDHEARAAAQAALDPQHAEDVALLRASLSDASARVRRAAAVQLRAAEPNADVIAALEQAARVDPALTVRVAALHALGQQGSEAFPALRERLSDPEEGVRMTALMALAMCDPTRAVGELAAFLATPPSSSSVEAARLLALRHEEAGAEAARAGEYLLSALGHDDANVRAQAAVALSSLSSPESVFALDPETGAPRHEAALLARLETETDRRARVVLAQILQRGERTQAAAEAVLREMMTGDDVPAVMAAVALSRAGDAAAVARLDAALVDARATHRRIAAGAMAQDAGDADRARGALVDEDALTRVAAAGGILVAD